MKLSHCDLDIRNFLENIVHNVIFTQIRYINRKENAIIYKTLAKKTTFTMNFGGKFLGNLKEAYSVYETMKRRQSGKQVCSGSESCGNNTNCFLKNGQWMGSAGRSGPCGTEKDHSRVYLCENCYRKRQGN